MVLSMGAITKIRYKAVTISARLIQSRIVIFIVTPPFLSFLFFDGVGEN
tara:strand:+ start:734 stop:880 length:147 start_codon:yes stop_codon:yes gene_type:complete